LSSIFSIRKGKGKKKRGSRSTTKRVIPIRLSPGMGEFLALKDDQVRKKASYLYYQTMRGNAPVLFDAEKGESAQYMPSARVETKGGKKADLLN